MNIVQSFWTAPAVEERWGINSKTQLEVNKWMCAASCLLAQRNGARVTMYTDRCGAVLLNKIPYDRMVVCLNEELEGVPTFFWAAGKFVALEDAPLGSVHIDNDVLLMERKTVQALEFDDYDFVVQQEEPIDTVETQQFYRPHRDAVKYLGFPERMNPEYGKAYNVGVIGFNNDILRDMYIDNYRWILDYVRRRYVKQRVEEIKKNPLFSLDLIYEQIYLYQLSTEFQFRGKCLLDRDNLTADVEKLNYRHLLGASKYQMLPQIQNLVKQLDEKLYKHLYENCK